jgi:diguanylate cyclase (GGDEF)-like protein
MGVRTTEVPQSRPFETLTETNARLMRRVAELEHETAQARHLAYHDSLTGLPNRALLLDRLNQAMLQATRQHKAVGLLLFDLDGFKTVNDRWGHNMGDLLLRQVAARVLSCIRGCDTACRYGGDEFIVMLPEIDGAADVAVVRQKVRVHLSMPYQLHNQVVALGASIGTAIFTSGEPNCTELIGAADAQMYRAKIAASPESRAGAPRALSASANR